jgi:hypothetical protein
MKPIKIFKPTTETKKLFNITYQETQNPNQVHLSFGNVPLSIYRQGPKQKKLAFLEKCAKKHPELAQLNEENNLKIAIKHDTRRFVDKLHLNFIQEKEVFLLTLTLNTNQDNLETKTLDGSPCKLQLEENCKYDHIIKKVSKETSCKIRKQTYARTLLREKHPDLGVKDLFDQFIHDIKYYFNPKQ